MGVAINNVTKCISPESNIINLLILTIGISLETNSKGTGTIYYMTTNIGLLLYKEILARKVILVDMF